MPTESEARIIANSLLRAHSDLWPGLLLPLMGEAEYVAERVKSVDPGLWETIIAAALERVHRLTLED